MSEICRSSALPTYHRQMHAHRRVEVPPEWFDVVGANHATLDWLDVKMPNLGPSNTWLGNLTLLPPRGIMATAFMVMRDMARGFRQPPSHK